MAASIKSRTGSSSACSQDSWLSGWSVRSDGRATSSMTMMVGRSLRLARVSLAVRRGLRFWRSQCSAQAGRIACTGRFALSPVRLAAASSCRFRQTFRTSRNGRGNASSWRPFRPKCCCRSSRHLRHDPCIAALVAALHAAQQRAQIGNPCRLAMASREFPTVNPAFPLAVRTMPAQIVPLRQAFERRALRRKERCQVYRDTLVGHAFLYLFCSICASALCLTAEGAIFISAS